MYRSIFVPVDNSEYSNQAVTKAVQIAQNFGASITGCHVYAAQMHDYRFKQMEFTLPGEYLLEDELERQRRIHDSLITMGLQLISDSYLDQVATACEKVSVECRRRMMDGKHHQQLVKEINAEEYDLTVLGALGVGKTRESQIGSVCENVARRAQRDLLVIKHLPKDDEPERDTILIGIDGSPQSFGALLSGMELARRFNKRVELIGVYDPYLHYAVFNSIVDVLSEKAAKVFRFEEQNQLHEEIIDCGLAQIYQSHLNIGEKILGAKYADIPVRKTLLDGKAFHKILQRCREVNPWLLIVGRIGVHSDREELGLGSNTENLLRLCPCDILLSSRTEHPELDLKAEETILWTSEAEGRMSRVPQTVRGIARTAILRLALEQGHSVVTNSLIDDAMERFMPKYAGKATERLAGQLVLEQARKQNIAMCKKCGVTAREASPVRCAVCGAQEFTVVSPELIEQLVAEEGGVEEETAFDGRKFNWSREAKEQLWAISDKYQRRRSKARIEKAARMKKIDTITVEFAAAVIMDEVGRVLFEAQNEEVAQQLVTPTHYSTEVDSKLVALDETGAEVRSVFSWEDEATARLLQVPAGFMRERTQRRAEDAALEAQSANVSLEHLEFAIKRGQEAMIQTLRDTGSLSPEQEESLRQFQAQQGQVAVPTAVAAGKCPFQAVLKQQGDEPQSNVYKGVVSQVLNEIGVMSELNKRRQELK